MRRRGSSLLAVGVVRCEGAVRAGDGVELCGARRHAVRARDQLARRGGARGAAVERRGRAPRPADPLLKRYGLLRCSREADCDRSGRSDEAAVPRRPRRQPAPPAAAAAGARRLRRRPHRRRRAARGRGRRDPRDRAQAGGGRPAVRDRRRVPPRVVAHGLHLPARRDHEGSRPHRGQVPQRAGRHRVHAGGAARRREARRLDRRSSATTSRSCSETVDDERPEADDPVAEHGPLPRRQGRDRPERLPGPRRVLGRPRRRVPRGGAAARRARLHVPPVRRHEPRVHERPAPARVHRVDRRRSRAPARRVHPPHQRGARRAGRTG